MKKILFGSLVLLFLPLVSFAQEEECNHPVYDVTGRIVVSCISDEAWDAALSGQQDSEGLPTVAPGQVVTDEHGVQSTCPLYFHKCVDVSGTASYRNSMLSVARQLVALGHVERSFPRFAGWMRSVR